MFSGGGEAPSRYELLSMVKKHSNLLGKTIVDEQDAPDIEMDQNFWHDVLNLYFIQGRESRGRQDDDLMFFVRKMNSQGYSSNDDEDGNCPYFVRRWASKLDNMVGDNLMKVDWRRSFYLNLIAHTSYNVTVAICSNQVLQKHRVGQDTPLTPIYKVVKTVYASPSRVNFHLDARKEAETVPAYPDICFAIDDFDSTIDTVVLSDTDHCYCVVLNANNGAAFPNEKPQHHSSDDNLRQGDGDSEKKSKTKVTIFSGFVSYQMVREAYDAGRSRLGSLLSFSHSSGKTDRPFSPVVSNKGFGIGSVIRHAASAASVAAKHAYAAASRNTDDDEMLPLKCCLMSISLPWEHIAYDLLFKGDPPVSM